MGNMSISGMSGMSTGGITGRVSGGADRGSKVNQVSEGTNFKLQRILNKFRAGKKLSSGELSYLAANAPDIYQKVIRIMQRREQLEKRLEMAESKEEVQMIMMEEMQSAEKFCANNDDDFETTAMINQLMNAYYEKTKSPGYKEMPENRLQEETRYEMADQEVTETADQGENPENLETPEAEAWEPEQAFTQAGGLAEHITYTAQGTTDDTPALSGKKKKAVDVAI